MGYICLEFNGIYLCIAISGYEWVLNMCLPPFEYSCLRLGILAWRCTARVHLPKCESFPECFAWWLSKESACNAEDPPSNHGSGRSPGEGNGYPLQYSRLENPMDGGAWWATVYGVAKSRIWLSDKHFRVLCTRSKWVAEEKQSLKYMATGASLQKIHPIISHVKLSRRFGFHRYLIKIEILSS